MKGTGKILLVGIGNAGVVVLDRIAVEHPELDATLVINNDADSLLSSVTQQKIRFPETPEEDLSEGFLTIEEEFAAAMEGASCVILCGGLGGVLGSFLLPALAARVKAEGMTTLASVGMPFAFEGRQKREAAAAALRKLHDLCDGVAVVENDRLAGGAPSTAAVGEAFASADRMLQASVLALNGMLSTTGPVKISRSDLAGVLGSQGAATHFGHGQAGGANRLHEALEQVFKSPLLTLAGKGNALKESSSVLLLLSGPSDLSFAEVQRAVSEIERVSSEQCQVKVGVLAQGTPGDALEIFLLASSGTASRSKSASSIPAGTPAPRMEPAAARILKTPEPAVVDRPVTSSVGTSGKTAPARGRKAEQPVQQTQGTLNLETYQRGRFDKSEPTIVEGQDLDIPTFLRKGIKLGSPARH